MAEWEVPRVSVSLGAKRNKGNYESEDVHVTCAMSVVEGQTVPTIKKQCEQYCLQWVAEWQGNSGGEVADKPQQKFQQAVDSNLALAQKPVVAVNRTPPYKNAAPALRQASAMVQEAFPGAEVVSSNAGEWVVPFGKHKGKQLHSIEQDVLASYVGWLKKSPRPSQSGSELIRQAERFLGANGAPIEGDVPF